MDTKQQIKKFDEENKPFYMVDHGDGYEWEYVFAKAFEGEENLKKISFDCEAGGLFCYSSDFDVLAEYSRRFREMCMNEQEFTELVCNALSEDRQPVEEEISTERMTPFFGCSSRTCKKQGI